MKQFLLLTLGWWMFMAAGYGQGYTISGRLQDKTSGNPVQLATVEIKHTTDSTYSRSAITDSLGAFAFDNVFPDSFSITFSSVGYTTVIRRFVVDTANVTFAVSISRKPGELETVVVTATPSPISQKGDTVQYNASQYKVNPDANVEDLVRKMPGITIENGQVKANGEVVQKVTIDGRELFGDDATAAVRNLPAEIVDKIQVFDRLSDQAQFTGVDDGNSQKGINIVTKTNMRNGQFGRLYAGYGTDSRYAAGGNATFLKENRKITLVGNFNNTNQQNFATQDLLGITSGSQGGGGRGGGGRNRGNNGGQGNNANSFLVNQQNGINKTNAAGVNYSDIWGKKTTVTGSYFFNNTANSTNESVVRQYFSKNVPNLSQATLSSSNNTNHRINLRIEYKFDSSNELIFTPNVSLQNNSSDRDVNSSFYTQSNVPVSRTHNINSNDRTAANLNGGLLFRHAFPKKGRTYSINLSSSYNNRTGNVYTDLFDTSFVNGVVTQDSLSRRYTDQSNNGYQLSANLIYTEPLSAKSQLQLGYNPGYTKSKADQQAFQYDEGAGKYNIFNPTLSSRFDNTTTAQRGGVTYRYFTSKDHQVSVGADFLQTELKSDRTYPQPLMVNKTFQNILPNAMIRWKVSANANIRVMYRSNTNQPSVTQLQDVYDITNSPFVTAGNPNLEQQYMHTISGRYTYTNTKKGMLFVGNVFYQAANNYITNATFVPLRDSVLNSDVVLKSGQQLSKPVNLDGYKSLRSFFTFAMPLKLIKSNLNMNGGVTFSTMPGIINSQLNKSSNVTYTLGAVVGSNISENVDFTVSYAANFNTVENDISAQLNQQYFSHLASVQLNLISKKGWFFQTDVNNQLYSGLSAGFNQNYFLWNMGVGKKFLKSRKAEIKLSVFDVLKQNRSIVRNVTETYIEDQQNQVLQRYFMLTFSYNLRNFGKGIPEPVRKKRRDRMM